MRKKERKSPADITEKMAINCLSDIYGLDLLLREERHQHDKPDLITNDETIGIEVTRGQSETQSKLIKIFRKDFGWEEQEKVYRELQKSQNIKCINGVVVVEDDLSAGVVIKTVSEQIIRKLENLQKEDFTRYASNRLFVHTSCFDEDIEKIMEKVREKNLYKQNFDTIYFFNDDYLHVYENNYFSNKVEIKKNYKV